MFHDPGTCSLDSVFFFSFLAEPLPELQRTTNSTGKIKEREWYGAGGMQHIRTAKEPKQSIPTFAETISLLMLVCRVLVVVLLPQAHPCSPRTTT
jgi:hypothetical protein